MNKHSLLLYFFFSLLLVSCGTDPDDAAEMYKNEKIILSGIQFDKKDLNDFFFETGMEGVTTDQFISSLNIKKEAGKKVDKAEVIVDMSAGMNIGIDKSFKAITAVMQRFNPSECKYFHVDDPANVEPINEIKSLSDANFLQNPANYKKSFSKLRSAFESATRSSDKISIIITDFLLDEGIKTDRRLKTGGFTKDETADNSTWASGYFTKWFQDKNQVLIYPFQYTAPNYYKKQETKNIYYIIFVPKGCINDKLENLKKDFSDIFKDVIDINPSDVKTTIDEKEIPGDCVEGYNLIKGQGSKPKVFADYYSEFIPFSFSGIKKNKYVEKPIVCNVSVHNGSPFKLNVVTEGYDLSKQYYDAIKTPKSGWKKNKLYEEAKQSQDIIGSIDSNLAMNFKFGPKVAAENFMSAYKTYAKLLYSRIIVKDMTLKPLHPSLSWDFQSKYGTMENNALSESIRLALDEYRNKNLNYQIGSVLVSVHDK